MSDEMDALVGRAARMSDADVEALSLHAAEAELMEEIMATPKLESAPVAAAPPPRPRSVRRRLVAAASIAAVTTAGVFAFVSSRDSGPAWAAELVELAEAVPRLVVDDPEWQIVDADESGPELSVQEGSMTLVNGESELWVSWDKPHPEFDYDARVKDLLSNSKWEKSVTVAGRDAIMVEFAPPDGPTVDGIDPDIPVFATLWQHDNYVVEARGDDFPDAATYEAVIEEIREVGVDDWLSALPASVVRPNGEANVVAEILSDIPVPDGFDRDVLVDQAGVSSRYQLGAQVTGQATCAWLDQWVEATDTGDDAAADEATSAMATSREWDILKEMTAEGEWSEVVWEYADALANGGKLPDGSPVDEVTPAGTIAGDTVLEEDVLVYDDALGCNE